MAITASSALWFLPFVLPICFYVAWKDMATMRIPNPAVLILAAVFVVVGIAALPFDTYLWRLSQLAVVLVLGFALTASGAVGAGDSKFAAAAAPFIAMGDLSFILYLFAATMLGAFAAHRLARAVPALRAVAPGWKSWSTGQSFPMGLALGGVLAIYLILGAVYGA